MKDYDMLKLDNQLCFALYASSRKVTKLYQPYLEKLGLTYTQYVTMLVLWEVSEINFKDLGNKLFLDSGTLTPLLKKLEKAGLIKRHRDPMDERSVIISLTPKGEEMKDAAACIPVDLFSATDVSVDEAVLLREKLKDIMQKL